MALTSPSCIWRQVGFHRWLATAAPSRLPPSPNHSIYVSQVTDPYFNLTLEDWLFRHKNPEEPLLLIYRDEPCVVIGRNQNPWKEVNMTASRTRNIPVIRRRSGGGTVYHDLGNTNFSIHLPRKAFDRHATSKLVLKAVQSLGINARVNDRNDICVGDEKVSGSAYKIVNARAYHHGTMLISTQLDTLGDLLRTSKDTMVTRGVASVRSPVCNLKQYKPDVHHESFVRAVVNQFREEYGAGEEVCYVEETEEMKRIEYIAKGMTELPSWEWLYGQTPEFTYKIQQPFSWGTVSAELRSSHGIVRSCSLQASEARLADQQIQLIARIGHSLEGQRYGFVNSAWSENDDIFSAEVANWLKAVMEN